MYRGSWEGLRLLGIWLPPCLEEALGRQAKGPNQSRHEIFKKNPIPSEDHTLRYMLRS